MINKKNFLTVVCCVYTVISLSATGLEWYVNKELTPTQFNLLIMIFFSCIGVFVLSLYKYLESIHLLYIIIIQYIIAISTIMISLWILGHFVELHPDGPRDIFVSFTIPYLIGVAIYYVKLNLEVKKQNEILNEIKLKEPEE